MKKIILATALLATVMLSGCGGHSQASREQISNAHENAAKMLKETHKTIPDQDKNDSIVQSTNVDTNK